MDGRISNLQQVASIRRYTLTEGRERGLDVLDCDNGKIRFLLNVSKACDVMQLYHEGQNMSFVSKNGFTKREIPFLKMFSQYQPPEDIAELIANASIVAADIDPQNRRVDISIFADTYISRKLLDRVSSGVCSAYGLRELYIESSFPESQLQLIEHEELMSIFVSLNTMTRGSLAGARWEWDDYVLNIYLLANGKAIQFRKHNI